MGGALSAAGKDFHPLRDAEVDLRSEAVSHVSGRGKPARGIKEVGDGLLDGRQLQTFDGAIFAAGDGAVVFKLPMSGLAGDERSRRCDADGSVGRALASKDLAGIVGDLVDLQRGMKTEADHLGVFRCGESDGCFGSEMVRGWVDLGVDDVACDVEQGAFGPLSGEGAGGKEADAKNQERRQRPESPSANDLRTNDFRFSIFNVRRMFFLIAMKLCIVISAGRTLRIVRILKRSGHDPICLIVMPATRLMAVSTSSPNPKSPGVRRPRKRASSFIMDWRSGPSGSRGSIWRTILAAVKSAWMSSGTTILPAIRLAIATYGTLTTRRAIS